MAIKVKVGVELDSKSVKASLDSTLKSLESKKIKLNIDMTSLKQLQTTITQLSKAMSGLKMPGINTSGASNSVNQALSGIKQQNNELKAQSQIYSQLKSSQNEEFKIRKSLITATGEHKTMLEGQLASVKEQQTEYRRQAEFISNVGNNSQKLLQIDEQRVQKIRDLSQAQEKYQTSMDKLKTDAISNLNTKGMSTKEIDDYKNKIESINRVSLDQVKSEISAINKEMANGQKSAQDYAKNLKNTGDSMASAGANIMKTFAIPAAGMALGVKTFADFESSLSTVKAVSELTDVELKQLSDTALQLGRDTQFSSIEIANGMGVYARAGWDAQQIMSGMGATLDLVAASGENFDVISNIMTDGLNTFSLSASDASHFADVLAMAANKSNLSVNDLGQSMKFAGPMANALGFSIEETSTALAIMAQRGIKAKCLVA